MVLGVGAASMLALTTSTAVLAAEPPTTCDAGHWPSTVEGMPTVFKAGATAGDYIWHDGNGWHVRVTHHGDNRLVFTGRVVSNQPLESDPVKLEKADQLTVSADNKTVTFRFTNYGAIDGFDFTTACATRLTFHFEIAARRTPPGRIWLGHGNRNTLEDPFGITRIATPV
jgi:hypothetical protein